MDDTNQNEPILDLEVAIAAVSEEVNSRRARRAINVAARQAAKRKNARRRTIAASKLKGFNVHGGRK